MNNNMDSNLEGKDNKAATSSSRISPSFDTHSIQHQLLRKPEGNEALITFQAGGLPGAMGGTNFPSSSSSMPLSQQQRMYMEMVQQHGSPHMRDNGPMKGHGNDQQILNPVHQAYLQYAYQAQHQKAALNLQPQQQGKMGTPGSSSGKDQDMRMANLNMQDFISMQVASQAQASSKKTSEPFIHGEKQVEQRQRPNSDQKSDQKPPTQHMTISHSPTGNVIRPMQMQPTTQGIQNIANNQIATAQLQKVQAWALENNIDLSQPANANLMARLLPVMQSRMVSHQKANDGNSQSSPVPVQRHHVNSPTVASESPRANSSSELSGQSGSAKARQAVQSGPFSPRSVSPVVNPGNLHMQQSSMLSRENQGSSAQATAVGDVMPSVQTPRPSVNLNQVLEQALHGKVSSTGNNQEALQMQHLRQLNQSSPRPTNSSNDGAAGHSFSPQAVTPPSSSQQRTVFTKQQLHVLKAQILAFRRIKKGEGTLPQELLKAIAPPPLEVQLQETVVLSGITNQEVSAGKSGDETSGRAPPVDKDSEAPTPAARPSFSKEESFAGNDKTTSARAHTIVPNVGMKEPPSVASSEMEEPRTFAASIKPDQDAGHDAQKTPVGNDSSIDRGKSVAQPVAASDAVQPLRQTSSQTGPTGPPKDGASTRKYHGPLFDFPFFTRKHDSLGSAMMVNNNNLTLGYEVKDLLSEEGIDVLSKKRAENLEKIGTLLAVNLERKRIRPDLVLRLQIEEKKLKLLDLQARLREKVDQEQQEIMGMSDREYRKFVKLCERQRLELSRQLQASQKAIREKQLKSIFQWRKKLLEAHWAIRDARTARNRGVAKYHERILREFSKRKDDDRNKRMEALKNNDVERYREMLLEQQTSIPGDAAERYQVLSSFLGQTEEYLQKLGSKITAAKNQQEVEEAAAAAAAAARSQGLSEEEIRAAAGCAGEEVRIRNQFMEMNAPRDDSSAGKYYTLAHIVSERVMRQPSMLRAGTLRDYQLVGLQWMLSLYNNKLNGILADEMGLGKTVQVMALIAYLMEFKGNYGPHLIIVPNAVLVNWKSELFTWLPSVSCIFYVGSKDQRSKLFSQEVLAMKFNVLVTTYEFIMFDRSKLSKVDWKYIIIDEAQRMKDRDSVLARDLDRYRCQRRLLLTGTPLQNDLKELWSLLNLLLPEVFDNRKAFHDWFSQPFQRESHAHDAEDDWLETEKKVIVIHRLHQILEPFMLRRRVEDVEGSLPPKVSFVLKCKMSPFQSAVYDWVKSTGTLRVDPEDEKLRVQRNPLYQSKAYKMLNNRCMELRKVCNHPLLNYQYFSDFSKDFLVRSCGKLWILDRILVKLQRTGHRVLLFSTMTKLLDILEEYLQWRQLVYRRIDGTTSLEDRESAIVDFNSPGSDCFIFLLSIRAAGRGLNLQSADTVVIYDPDPNPKNEEQAVARAHRIGQTREVKVIYLEAVVDKISSQQKEDDFRNGGMVDMEDDLAGKDRYIGSIESLIRNNIQQYKIDMADEVINAGRFDQRTTHEERRLTLETLLHDEERYQETVHDVPSLQEVNRLIARSEEEVDLFDQMDEELDWSEEMMRYDEVPTWLRANTKEVNATIAALSKKPSKDIFTSAMLAESVADTVSRRGRRKGKNFPVYTELDDDNAESSDGSSEEQNGYSAQEEDGDIGGFEEEEEEGAPGANKEQPEEEGQLGDDYDYAPINENTRKGRRRRATRSPGSSSDSRRYTRTISPSVSSQKFTTLSSLDARPSSLSKLLPDDLEEGEIAVSGESHMDLQQSGSWNHDREDGDDEQVLQPKIRRKRSIRLRPRHNADKQEDRYSNGKPTFPHGDSSQFKNRGFERQLRNADTKIFGDTSKQDRSESSSKVRRSLPTRRIGNAPKVHALAKPSRIASVEESGEASRESWDDKLTEAGANTSFASKMSNVIQRRCKNVISKLQRRIDKEGHQIVPRLADLWERMEGSSYMSGPGNHLLDLQKIDLRIDRLEYNGVMDVVYDVQMMLKGAIQYYRFAHEVRSEARKVHDLFFDILKIAFPNTDFLEARNALSFSSPAATSASASGSGPSRPAVMAQSKRHKLIHDVDQDAGLSTKPSLRSPTGAGEDFRGRGHMSTKESRLRSSSSSQEQALPEYSPVLTHPGELVVCKRKRKDREKSIVKTRTGSAGLASPNVARGIRSPGAVSAPRELRSNQHNAQQGWANQRSQVSGSGGTIGWANPVKRLRTDSGKRRPSIL